MLFYFVITVEFTWAAMAGTDCDDVLFMHRQQHHSRQVAAPYMAAVLLLPSQARLAPHASSACSKVHTRSVQSVTLWQLWAS